MSKQDLVWVALRVLGLFLVVKAILVLPMIPYSAMMWNVAEHFSEGEASNHLTAHKDVVITASRSTFAEHVFEFVLYTLTGLYFLRRGRFVMKLCLSSTDLVEPDTKGSGKVDAHP